MSRTGSSGPKCDLRVGGRWTIEFGPPDGPPSRETCVFEVVDRPRLLVFRSTMVLPDGSSVDTRTHVTFTGTAGRPDPADRRADRLPRRGPAG